MTKTPPRTRLVPSVRLIAVCAAVLLTVLITPRALRAQWQWHAAVGAQSKDLGHQALAFFPNELWVHAGDTITWKFEVDEIHTVTFLKTDPAAQVRPPFPLGCPGFSSSPATFDGTTCVTTPPFVKGQQFSVNFPKKGNFKLVCLVHGNMTGVVHVLDPLTPLPFDQWDYNEQAADQRRDILSDGDRDGDRDGDHDGRHDGRFGRHEEHGEYRRGHDVVAGTGEVTANGGGSQTLSILRFNHDTITIRVGGTVEWTNDDPVTPHTITFGTEPADPIPPSGNVTLDEDGARHVTLHSTADSAHSGFIVSAPQERLFLPQAPLGVTRFRATFTKAGTYLYICELHDDLGMKGKIIVLK
jgi:plastocyanin